MGLLTWLGFSSETYPNIEALMRELRKALPEDESVVLRYIAIVVTLLGRVACADGTFTQGEEENLRTLLASIDRLSPQGIDTVCNALRGKLPNVGEEELSVCCRELKTLCDRRERLEVMRLLAHVALVDGVYNVAERAELERIAEELDLTKEELSEIGLVSPKPSAVPPYL